MDQMFAADGEGAKMSAQGDGIGGVCLVSDRQTM